MHVVYRAQFERAGGGWRMVARDARGAPMTTCTLFERRASCDPAFLPR
jgi:hypothetical protein